MDDSGAVDRPLRVLVVEDNFLVAVSVKQQLLALGCEVVGPTPSLEDGLAHARSETLDGAILDINISGGTSIPIADSLRERSCPFVFITGYASPSHLPDDYDEHIMLRKPVDQAQLATTIDGFRRD